MQKRSVGRRGFVQATLGTTVAGVCSAVQQGPPQPAPGAKSYRETLQTPIVARHQVVVADRKSVV